MAKQPEEAAREQIRQQTLAKAYYVTFRENENGKLVLRDLMRYCGVWEGSYAGDTAECVHREGRRDVLLHILSMTMHPRDIAFLKERGAAASEQAGDFILEQQSESVYDG